MASQKKSPSQGLWRRPFLEAMSNTGNLRLACQAARVNRATVWKQRQRDPKFAAAYEDAIDQAVDVLELEAQRRAVRGTERVRSVRLSPDEEGNAVYERIVEKEFSDNLLMFLLKGARPEKYRENYDVNKLIAALTAAQGTTTLPGRPDP